jgi:hypothetical protein
MLLAGHNHHADIHSASDLVTRAGGALVVQAGTATSTRVRDQAQSFNTIDIGEAAVTVTVNVWSDGAFEPEDAKRYAWKDGSWRSAVEAVPAT